MTFIQFGRLLRWLFTSIALLVALPLICVNYWINTSTQWGSLTTVSMNGTSANVSGSQTTSNQTAGVANILGSMQVLTAATITGPGLCAPLIAGFGVTCLVVIFGEPLCDESVLIQVNLHLEHNRLLTRAWVRL